MPFKRAFKHRWSFDHKSSHTEIWNIWNYWNYCCGIAFVTGINTTICCGLEYLHTIPCCWGSRGREFKSRHSDHRKPLKHKGFSGFYFFLKTSKFAFWPHLRHLWLKNAIFSEQKRKTCTSFEIQILSFRPNRSPAQRVRFGKEEQRHERAMLFW